MWRSSSCPPDAATSEPSPASQCVEVCCGVRTVSTSKKGARRSLTLLLPGETGCFTLSSEGQGRRSRQKVILFAERSEGKCPRKENQPCERINASWTASRWLGTGNTPRAYRAYFRMTPHSKIFEKSCANNGRKIVGAPWRRLSRSVKRKQRNVHP